MASVTEYLEQALHFDHLAADERDPSLKVEYQRQADARRRLAIVEAKQLGIELPRQNPTIQMARVSVSSAADGQG